MRLALALLAVVAVMSLRGPVDACVIGPKDFAFPVENGPQRGIVMWDNGRQEMVLMPGYALGSPRDKEAKLDVNDDGLVRNLVRLAWLVPVPSAPDSYQEAEAGIFKDIHEFTKVRPRLAELKSEDGPVLSEEGAAEEGMKFPQAVSLGEYTIQPIKASGEQGAKDLAAWLKDNGFGEVSPQVLRWYVARQWWWLAIRLNSSKGLPESGDAKPIHISFKTPQPVFPLKILDGRGDFDAEIWVITRERLDLAKSSTFGLNTADQLDDYYVQENRETGYARLPASVQALCKDSEDLKALRLGAIFCYRFSGRGLESPKGQDVGTWLEDLTFRFEKDAAPKPAQEVKPTPPPEPIPEEGK